MEEHKRLLADTPERFMLRCLGGIGIACSLVVPAVVALCWQESWGNPDWLSPTVWCIFGSFLPFAFLFFLGNGGMDSLMVDVERLGILQMLGRIFGWGGGIVAGIFFIWLYMLRPEDGVPQEDAAMAQAIGAGAFAAALLGVAGLFYADKQVRLLERIPGFAERYTVLPVEILAPKLNVRRARLRRTILLLLEKGRFRGSRYDESRDVLLSGAAACRYGRRDGGKKFEERGTV